MKPLLAHFGVHPGAVGLGHELSEGSAESAAEGVRQSPLTVLITNNTASFLAGTERYVEQVCGFLIENGNFPIVYSTQIGEMADILRNQGVPVVDDLREITITPDIIHGHHHLDVACALARFPDVPCLYFVHGVIPWEECCFPDIPRIYRYISVSNAKFKKAFAEGIPPNKVVTLPNFVDRRRFGLWSCRRPQDDLSQRSLRALIFGNYPHGSEREIRKVSAQLQIELHCAGGHYGAPVKEPEHLFPGYDIVFAYGKSAMEALCCGCEVILSSHLGIGDLITSDNFQKLRDRNFGFSVSRAHPSESHVLAQMQKAAQRRSQGLSPVDEGCIASLYADAILPRLVHLYREAIAFWAEQSNRHDLSQEMQAYSRYLRFLQVSRFAAMEAQQEASRKRQELDRELEQARTERARALEEMRTRPLRFLFGDRLARWGSTGRRPAAPDPG